MGNDGYLRFRDLIPLVGLVDHPLTRERLSMNDYEEGEREGHLRKAKVACREIFTYNLSIAIGVFAAFRNDFSIALEGIEKISQFL